MPTAIGNNILTSATDSAEPKAKTAQGSICIATNARPEARERLLRLGYAVRVVDVPANNATLATWLDADVVVVDRSMLGPQHLKAVTLSFAQRINIPIVFINGLARQQANHHTDVVDCSEDANSMDGALKIAAILAEQAPAGRGPMACGNLVLQPESRRAYWNGVDVDLTMGEYRVIQLLVSEPDRYFAYPAIYDGVRHKGFVSSRGPTGYRVNVRAAVKRIRAKFRALDATFDEIESYAGFGYRWHNNGTRS
jgi:two-component system, OmpR family, response regulator ChvI